MRVSRAEAKKHGLHVEPVKRRKYRNVPTTVDGTTFHSKREAKRYSELRLLEKARKITDLVLQPEFEFVVNGVKVGKYVADFAFYDIAAKQMIVEDVKGVRTPVYRLKKKLAKALHGIEVVEV